MPQNKQYTKRRKLEDQEVELNKGCEENYSHKEERIMLATLVVFDGWLRATLDLGQG